MNTGLIALITIGAGVVIGILAALLFWLYHVKKIERATRGLKKDGRTDEEDRRVEEIDTRLKESAVSRASEEHSSVSDRVSVQSNKSTKHSDKRSGGKRKTVELHKPTTLRQKYYPKEESRGE